MTLLDSVPCGDSVTAVACFRQEPYVLLGCESGCIQLLGFTDKRGKLVEGVGAVASTSLLPYQRTAHLGVQTVGNMQDRLGHFFIVQLNKWASVMSSNC